MRFLTLILLLFLPRPLLAQANRNFKAFYQDGNDSFEQGNFQEAIKSYKEALRLEPKAQRYKVEGTFFANYMPRYRLALSFEKSDILEAERWANDSKTASESSIIKKRDKANAEYHADLERISNAAADFRKKQDARFTVALNAAQSMLREKKFEAARKAYQALYTDYPDRSEAQLGLGQVDAQKQNYLRKLELDFKEALVTKNFSEAEGTLGQITQVDKAYAELPNLRAKLKEARDEATRIARLEAKRKAETEKPVTVARDQPETKETPTLKPEVKPEQTPADTTRRDRKRLRDALLETLKPYRRGDPEEALAQLEQIESPVAEGSGSYHWLRGLYALTSHHYAAKPDPKHLSTAEQALALVATIDKDFMPDEQLYPRFVLEFYQKKRQANGK